MVRGRKSVLKIILCIDDNGGMLFNNRRQSKDKALIEKVCGIVGERKLWITDFSKDLFEWEVQIDPQMLDKASEGEFCFVENLSLAPYLDKIEELYLFKWNRKYPSDVQLDIMIDKELSLISSEDFIGNSHEKITLEVWGK